MKHYLEYNGRIISIKEDGRAPAIWAFCMQDNLEDDGRRKIVVEKSPSFDFRYGPYVVDRLKMMPSSILGISKEDVEHHVIPCLERKTLEAGSKEEFYLPKAKKPKNK